MNSYADDAWDVYWYGKNLQGDIVNIYNSTGAKLISYTYTAWGTTTKNYHNSGANTTATYNNLTYRGYYYDSDLDMYYLQSRYYDANICRFINADSALYDKILGYNLLAYCYNNPVYYIDLTGKVAVANKDNDENYLNDFMFEGGARGAGANGNTGGNMGNSTSSIRPTTTGARSHGGSGDASGTKSNVGNNVCFVAGTSVKTESGENIIENIRVGDKVYSYDEKYGGTALKTVVNTFVNEATELVHIITAHCEIVCTNEHPFYSPIKGWISACKLRAGDILVSLNGEYVIVEQVQHEILENPVKVYNFEVEDFHTYYVGTSDGILVHNTCRKFNSDQQAVIDLARENKAGLTRSEAEILVDFAKEYGINAHAPMIHPNRSGIWSFTEHIKIFNMHILVS